MTPVRAPEAASLPQAATAASPISAFLMIQGFETGGSERQFAILARSLDRERFRTTVGCIRRIGPIASEFEDAAEFRLGGSLYGWTSLKTRLRLRRLLRSSRTQIAHSFDFYTNLTLIPAARWARVPVVIGSHRQSGDLMTRMQFRAQAAAFRMCDAVVCNSRAGADSLAAAGISREKLVVIGNALADSAFEPVPPALARSSGRPRVIMVARMNAHYKNHHGFLRIAAQIRRQMPNVEFLLAGDGPLRSELEQDAESLGVSGSVMFLGERFDVPALLASADVAVLTSESEGLSNAILEAMAAGLPVVAYDVGGNSELVNDSRGALVPAHDENGFANAVQRLLSDPSLRQELGGNALQFAREHFSLDLVRRRYEELYETLLQAKGQRASSS